jgi:antitoxin VapB
MSLNIKNERVHAMAREAARRTGLSQTSVVELALRELLDKVATDSDHEQDIDEILAVIDTHLTDDDRARLTTDDLYDERGLPA